MELGYNIYSAHAICRLFRILDYNLYSAVVVCRLFTVLNYNLCSVFLPHPTQGIWSEGCGGKPITSMNLVIHSSIKAEQMRLNGKVILI